MKRESLYESGNISIGEIFRDWKLHEKGNFLREWKLPGNGICGIRTPLNLAASALNSVKARYSASPHSRLYIYTYNTYIHTDEDCN